MMKCLQFPGQCAACSSLQDLGVYMSQNLTEPTRLCGAMGSISEELEYDCMKALGFSDECVSIWIFNIHNTKKECFEVCLKSWADGEDLLLIVKTRIKQIYFQEFFDSQVNPTISRTDP